MWEYPDHFRCQYSRGRRRSLSEAMLRSNSSLTGMNEFILSMFLTVVVTTSSLQIPVLTFEMMCCDLKNCELNISFSFLKFFFFFLWYYITATEMELGQLTCFIYFTYSFYSFMSSELYEVLNYESK